MKIILWILDALSGSDHNTPQNLIRERLPRNDFRQFQEQMQTGTTGKTYTKNRLNINTFI